MNTVDFTDFWHPVAAVACPDCQARPAVRCKRPSGHQASDFHRSRKDLADAIFIQQHGEQAGIVRQDDGSWRLVNAARPSTQTEQLDLFQEATA